MEDFFNYDNSEIRDDRLLSDLAQDATIDDSWLNPNRSGLFVMEEPRMELQERNSPPLFPMSEDNGDNFWNLDIGDNFAEYLEYDAGQEVETHQEEPIKMDSEAHVSAKDVKMSSEDVKMPSETVIMPSKPTSKYMNMVRCIACGKDVSCDRALRRHYTTCQVLKRMTQEEQENLLGGTRWRMNNKRVGQEEVRPGNKKSVMMGDEIVFNEQVYGCNECGRALSSHRCLIRHYKTCPVLKEKQREERQAQRLAMRDTEGHDGNGESKSSISDEDDADEEVKEFCTACKKTLSSHFSLTRHYKTCPELRKLPPKEQDIFLSVTGTIGRRFGIEKEKPIMSREENTVEETNSNHATDPPQHPISITAPPSVDFNAFHVDPIASLNSQGPIVMESDATITNISFGHKRTYPKGTNYICNECGKIYASRKNVKRHRMTVHRITLDTFQATPLLPAPPETEPTYHQDLFVEPGNVESPTLNENFSEDTSTTVEMLPPKFSSLPPCSTLLSKTTPLLNSENRKKSYQSSEPNLSQTQMEHDYLGQDCQNTIPVIQVSTEDFMMENPTSTVNLTTHNQGDNHYFASRSTSNFDRNQMNQMVPNQNRPIQYLNPPAGNQDFRVENQQAFRPNVVKRIQNPVPLTESISNRRPNHPTSNHQIQDLPFMNHRPYQIPRPQNPMSSTLNQISERELDRSAAKRGHQSSQMMQGATRYTEDYITRKQPNISPQPSQSSTISGSTAKVFQVVDIPLQTSSSNFQGNPGYQQMQGMNRYDRDSVPLKQKPRVIHIDERYLAEIENENPKLLERKSAIFKVVREKTKLDAETRQFEAERAIGRLEALPAPQAVLDVLAELKQQ